MTATQPKPQPAPPGKTYRAKVTGRHAITLPAELCRQLGIEVGDSVEIVLKNGTAELRPVPAIPVLPISALRGILRPYYQDWNDIQQHVRELREEWDDDLELDDIPETEQSES